MRLRRHCAAIGLPIRLPGHERGWQVETLIEHFGHDKKVEGGALTFILAHGIGQAFISRAVPLDELRGLLGDWIEAAQ